VRSPIGKEASGWLERHGCAGWRAILSQMGRGAIVLASMLAVASATMPVPPREPAASAIPVVAGFSVSDDLSVATIDLLHAAGALATGPHGSLLVGDDGKLRIPLDFAGATEPTTVTVSFPGVSSGNLRVTYYPSEYYQTIGAPSQGTIVLFTTLPRSPNPEAPESSDLSPAESLYVHQQRWIDARYVGALPSPLDPLDEQIRQLYVQFDELNDPSIARLCDDSMTGIDTYWGMASNSCYVWCSGYARITRGFLRSIGLGARLVGLSAEVGFVGRGILVQSSEAHTTVDVWLDGQWQWIDPTFRLLRVADASGRALTIDGAIRDLADPSTRGTLRFTRLDPTTHQWATLAYLEEDQQFKRNLASYMSGDKLVNVPNDGRG
jgi:hypothetical protein